MALCYLLACTMGSSQVHALTVDHRLRPNSREEADKVSQVLQRKLGVVSKRLTLQWPSDQPPSIATLETQARIARYAQLAQACTTLDVPWLWMGHHADDVQETLLFRLARASGIYGLTGLTHRTAWPYPRDAPIWLDRTLPPLGILRPLLSIPKQRLIATCQHHNIPWFEDPTNKSDDYQRNVIRNTLNEIRTQSNNNDTTLSFTQINQYGQRMLMHRQEIDRQVNEFMAVSSQFDMKLGIYHLTIDATFSKLPRIIRHRVLSIIYQRIRVGAHPPRLVHLEQMDHLMCSSCCSNTSFETIAGLVFIRPSLKNVAVWRIAPQPLTAKEKEAVYLLNSVDSTTIIANSKCKYHYYGVWHQRYQICITSTSPLDELILRVRPFDVKSDTAILKQHLNQMTESNRQCIEQFCKLHVMIRSSQPVVVATRNPSFKGIRRHLISESTNNEQIIGLPTINVSLVSWIDEVVAVHRTTSLMD
ncbi:PP-loop family-domain-containing protein [Syncephalis plumigaleata]|nr:PP-loop family-domain-containing protein [Syncephalis plumigaleata]